MTYDINGVTITMQYMYKLRRDDYLYRDASNWTKRGKLYRSRNSMKQAIRYIIDRPGDISDRLKKETWVVECIPCTGNKEYNAANTVLMSVYDWYMQKDI